MKYLYLLSISDAETGEDVGNLEAYSLESLEDQLRKVPVMIDNFEEKNRDFAEDEKEMAGV